MLRAGGGLTATLRIAWHGCASYTLEVDGRQVLVDPFFSPAGTYGPWYTPNPHAPTLAAYRAAYRPQLVLITHGHFDHCDLETLRQLRELPVVTSQEVAAALRRHLGVAATPAAPGETLVAAGLHLRAVAGVHWLTGAEGDEAARKLDRPERYGVFPAGGPSLGFLLAERVYASGDTTLAGVPAARAPVAVLCVGTRMAHPVTRAVAEPILTAADVPAAARRLAAGVVVPVHWDFPLFLDPFDWDDLLRRMAAELPACRVVRPPYNTWVTLEG
jgi:L-ascorbate metabolism protein UlaG (beta-lactamase superfamily)